ncbi:hypothetical protein HMPREF9005_0372 [Actinomyces sp. oral taxon 178 str. F0338]|nr:hypothetical protein HMPREF9005_0372 [Actinomyces sp. oral taxon 178 str. F0338]
MRAPAPATRAAPPAAPSPFRRARVRGAPGGRPAPLTSGR